MLIVHCEHNKIAKLRGYPKVYGTKLIKKDISGWINYSGIVTSHKMSENKMDNRGSKSIVPSTCSAERGLGGLICCKRATSRRQLYSNILY